MSKLVANGSMGNFGWQLMVAGEVAARGQGSQRQEGRHHLAGSGSDLLALWTVQEKKIDFTRVPVGGGGLVPNLLAGNIDAAVCIHPEFSDREVREARTILDYAKDVRRT